MDETPANRDQPTAVKRRRWYQYSLRALLIGIVVLSLPLGWLGWKIREARQQHADVAAIEKRDVEVEYDYEIAKRGFLAPRPPLPGPAWLRALLGDDFFRNVGGVYLADAHPAFTDADLKSLTRFTHLKELYLDHTRITDAGVEHPKGLSSLEVLDLGNTQVTDVGIAQLKELTRLNRLSLANTRVTAAGVANLQKALPHCRIDR